MRVDQSNRERRHQVGNFVAVDGESTTDGDDHRYVIMGSSTGKSITRKNGIKTSECLDFLLALKRENPHSTFVAFFFGYDITMLLKDLPDDMTVRLYKKGTVTWRHYKISNVSRKFFTVKDLRDNCSVRINDTQGFFQCSFVKALEAWKITSTSNIADMKSRRNIFATSDIPEMRRYCLDECVLLVEMMQKLEGSLHDAGIRPSGWYGAGCIASAILRQNDIKRYRKLDTELPTRVQDALLRAYFGGRVETFYCGQFGESHSHDVRSAYPAAIAELPSSVGEWFRTSKLPQYGVVLVSWRLPKGMNIGPFPHRSKRKIFYPSHGQGFYHAVEVRAAMPKYGTYIRIHYAYGFEPTETGVTPFDFVPRLYEERARAKREGRASQLSLKLGLNSLYGKMAQGYGYKGAIPPFRTYLWAGQITATTRAAILSLLSTEQESSFIGFATDGVMMTERAEVTESERLGDWEVSRWDDLFVCQPGMYHGTLDGKRVTKTRGFSPREVNWESVSEGYKRYGPYYIHEMELTRFIGIGSSIQRANLSLRGHWVRERRRLSLYPQRKFVTHEFKKGHVFKTPTPFQIVQGEQFNSPSDPYVPKGGLFTDLMEASKTFVNLHEQPVVAY